MRFDPGRRLHLGIAHAPALEGDDLDAQRWQLDGGLAWRHVVDFEDEGIRWKLEHQVLDSAVAFGGDGTAVDGELYALRFLRWSDDGSITLPTTPPRRIGFRSASLRAASVASTQRRMAGEARSASRAGANARSAPTPRAGSFLTLGVGRTTSAPGGEGRRHRAQRVEHLVARSRSRS